MTITRSSGGQSGNITRVTSPNGRWIAFSYDAGNRLTQAVDSQSGTLTRSFDGLDRLVSEATPQGSVSYGYDNAGRRTGLTVAGQSAVTYGYDAADQLTSLAQGAASARFTYDAAGRRSTLTLPNGIVVAYGYDNANRLTSLAYQNGATSMGNLTYTYDTAGHRTLLGGSLARTGLPAAVSAATYDADNRVTAWAGSKLAYDANGNLASDGTYTYTWDERNRLTQMSIKHSTAASFAYDPFGRRTIKTIGATTTGFLYDGVNPVQELSGTTPTANLLTGLGVDEVFARTDANGARNYLADALGSTIALADGSGTVQTSYTYEPYGNTTQSGQASGNALQYTGRENDGTGLYYYRARYYSPTMQRFVAEDPIGLAGGINLYAYVNGNPLTEVDPYGLWQFLAQAYGGFGGGIKVSYDNGTLEILGRIGTGFGTSFQFDPYGAPSKHSKSCGNGYIARTYYDAGAQLNLGVFSLGKDATLYSGNAITTPEGGWFVENSSPSWFNLSPGLKPFGFDLGASFGAEIGSYSNW